MSCLWLVFIFHFFGGGEVGCENYGWQVMGD